MSITINQFGVMKVSLPKELLYSNEHEWVKKEEGNKVRIGVTEFAQDELGDIVFVELPEIGDQLVAEEPFGSVESVKTVSELYAPVSGKVVQINEDLEKSPELVNESPYDKAWMVIVEVTDETQIESLLSAEEYERLLKGE